MLDCWGIATGSYLVFFLSDVSTFRGFDVLMSSPSTSRCLIKLLVLDVSVELGFFAATV